MDLELEGRAAIVTGAGRGIGKAVARELAREGMDVAICARTREQLESAAEEISSETGRRVLPIVCDVTRVDQVETTVKKAVSAFGRLDVLVNNAGVPGGIARGPIETVTDEDVLLDLNTKYMGYLRFARACAPFMKQAKFGRIINIGGMSGRRGGTYSTGARNVAVAHMTKTLSEELGQFGITSNCIYPGATMIELLQDLFAQRAREQGKAVEEIEREVGGENAIKRIIDSSEVAHVVAFLASPKSISITGETFSVSGGMSRAFFN